MHIISPHTGEPISSELEVLPSNDEVFPTVYLFDPCDDVTIVELAFMVRFITLQMGIGMTQSFIDNLPEAMRRHFTSFDPQPEAANDGG